MTIASVDSRLAELEGEVRAAVKRFKGFKCKEQGLVALAYYEGAPTDVLGIMPTGMGKSLCSLLPTYLWKRDDGRGLTVVVSPLLALMQDQVDQVERHNDEIGEFELQARQLNSSITTEEKREVRKAVRAGEVNLLYLSPETLVQPWTYEMLADAARNRILRGLVIDEAHMVTEWGDQFRTSFKRMGPVRKLLQQAAPEDAALRTLVLTATLPEDERPEVLRAIGCEPEMRVFEHRAIRAEHVLSVRPFENHEEKLRHLAKDVGRLRKQGAGIIYCAQRKHCEEIAELLNQRRLGPARHFHGGTPVDERRQVLHEFHGSRKLIIVATDAFGLGVDKPDVRWVVHFSMPESIDQYYQEIGRSGRDGRPCEAVLYYAPVDRGQATKNALNVLSTDKFDSRLRCLRNEALALRRSKEGVWRLVEEDTIPDYVEDPEVTRSNKASVRFHRNWNYAVLIRAEQLGWLRLGPDVLHEVNCVLAPRSTKERAFDTAPTLRTTGLLRGLSKDRPTTLAIGEAAKRDKLDPQGILRLQREFFDLLLGGIVRLPEDGERLWNTRVLVEDLTGRHTARLGEDRTLRLGKQRHEGKQVTLMAGYAKSTRCRRWHFYRAYGYTELFPKGGCGVCDVCS